ncbi:MAG: hypothetical protein ACKOA7_02020 [Bacteroidota bacterium]
MMHHLKTYFFINIFILLNMAFSVNAQNFAFEGALFLSGQQSKPISYRIDFSLLNGVISGHSITDLFGPHETKNEITGTYTPSDGVINFHEESIVYTKSPLQREIFCFVRFSGKVQNDSGIARIKGAFTGRYKNQQHCARGSLMMLGSSSIQQVVKELSNNNKKIEKLYDSIQSRRLNADENLSVFMDTDSLIVSFRDQYLEDGDVINFSHNGKLLLKGYKVTSIPHRISIALQAGENVFTLEAVHEGTRPPNTAMVAIVGATPVEFQSNLKKGQKAIVQIVRSHP